MFDPEMPVIVIIVVRAIMPQGQQARTLRFIECGYYQACEWSRRGGLAIVIDKLLVAGKPGQVLIVLSFNCIH